MSKQEQNIVKRASQQIEEMNKKEFTLISRTLQAFMYEQRFLKDVAEATTIENAKEVADLYYQLSNKLKDLNDSFIEFLIFILNWQIKYVRAEAKENETYKEMKELYYSLTLEQRRALIPFLAERESFYETPKDMVDFLAQ